MRLVTRYVGVAGHGRAVGVPRNFATSRVSPVAWRDGGKGISDDARALEPEVPWRKIAGMRDVLIHESFGVELGLVWDVVEDELPTPVDWSHESRR
ncbi:MAG: HepT-like ribonuclease domain-containing protein [Solirubrobacteraceae bacterium]